MGKKTKLWQRWLSLVLAIYMALNNVPFDALAQETGEPAAQTEATEQWENVNTDALCNAITVAPGQLVGDTGEIVENEIYGYVVNYPLKKGHILSISDSDYVFSVRKLENGNYSTMLKQATVDSFTATEDMTIGCLIRKPDKSALTAEELANVVLYDSQFGMIGVEGSVHRFTVEAETIDGSTATTRAAIFLPDSYSESGTPTRLIVMTNGHSAHLTDSVWNKNTADNVGIIRNYLNSGYAVYVVDNTAAKTSQTPDLGCPQLVSSYRKAYEYIQQHFNVEEKMSIHSRSFGTFAAMRLMREVPELIKCAVMTGARVSIKKEWPGLDKKHIANRFGFADTTGNTYEADKMVGYDPYLDVDGDSYALPPTYWVLCQGDATAEPLTVVEKLIAHGNDVSSIIHTGTDHTGVCTLNTEAMFSDALTFLNGHQEEPLAGKTLSILGASISTFAGTSNGAAADTTNSTIRNNVKYYPNTTIPSVELGDTWWMQTVEELDLRLLVNNAWSGSAILLERAGTVGAYVDRCVQLHDDTGSNAGEEPDIICIQMGFNDFSYGKDTLGTSDIDYDALITSDGYGTPATTMEATAIMLDKITKRYPNAQVYMFNHFKRIGQSASDTALMEGLNASIETVCARFGVTVVDLYSALTKEAYIGDGRLHPNPLGMDVICEAVKNAILAGHEQETVYSVSCVLDGVSADCIESKRVLSGGSFAAELTAADPMDVTVTMGGADITASAYANGKVSIASVTGDVVITAKSVHVPRDYRWEFNGTDLAGENTLTKTGGTTTDGVFSKTRYTLEEAVVLNHDQPWVVEWKCEGTFLNANGASGARVFTSDNVNAHYNARYIFKSNTDGLIAMGEKTTTGSHNYGIALADHGIDWTAEHTYRLENRIAADGSNMVWLYVDGAEIGPMVHYHVGTTDKNTTSNWLSGKDFRFPYMGTDTHGFTNGSIDYIAVWEGGESIEPLDLRYDDHYDITGKTVEILDAGMPSSWQVGYGVEENKVPDTAVVTVDGNYLVATGIGTAKVRIDGQLYEITVTAAPISLLLLAGQSNMRGSEGNAAQSIVCPEGMVYATYGDDRGADNTAMTAANATQFAPSALTGLYSGINVTGTTDCLSGYPVYSLTEAGAGKIGPDSGFAYEWVKSTGEKVWIVNAAHGGTSINAWQPGKTEYEECQALFTACTETLRKEIAAGHFTLSHMAYFWCQGCSDRAQSAQWYVEKYLAMHQGFKTELAFDHDSDAATADKTFEFGGIIPVRVGSTAACYRDGVSPYTNSYAYHESFVDLRFSGPRAAQYWMINNPELTDIWGVCDIGDDWVWMPDGTNGVAEYFQSHYENGTVDYTTQVAQKASWYTPTTPKAVHDSIHYNQIGYNEVGREAVRNALIMLGETETPRVEATVELMSWDGITPAEEIKAWTTGCSGSLVVPVVSPIWKAKEVTYTLTDGLRWEYYDLLADTAQTEGTLTAGTGETVSVVKQEPGAYFADHLSQLPEKLCLGVNLWNVLEHDPMFYTSGTNWGTHSSGNVYSVTIPVRPGDKIFATAFGKAGENGHATSSGIRCTFFGEYAVVKTLDPGGTYAEFSKNGGYLVVPEGAVAMNIPMWTGDDTNELYILNLPHDRTEGICGICGKDSHVHSWGDWEAASLPTADAPGTEERKCACGETESREVEGAWQKYNLADHMQEMPESYCAGTNLWAAMEHDVMYFASGTSWGKYSGGGVCSVTIPVRPGDKIFATSFGKAGENGHATSSGIRCTFFDAYGVCKTMNPAGTYAEFSANGGYLVAPEGAVAFNVPMWSGSDENKLYILNASHSYGYEVDTAPTSEKTGMLKGICQSCGGDSSVELPVLNEKAYDYAVTKEPTAAETGIGAYTWKETVYGTVVITVTLDKLILYGDVNGDGRVNNLDRLTLTRYLAKWTDYPAEVINMAAADVNADGTVNNLDRLILTRHLAKWTGYEELPYKK